MILFFVCFKEKKQAKTLGHPAYFDTWSTAWGTFVEERVGPRSPLMSRLCNCGPKKFVPRDGRSLTKRVQAKQPPLWPVGMDHVGPFTLRGKTTRSSAGWFHYTSKTTCLYVQPRLVRFLALILEPSSPQLAFNKHARPLFMLPLVSNKATKKKNSGFGISEKEEGEGGKWRNAWLYVCVCVVVVGGCNLGVQQW